MRLSMRNACYMRRVLVFLLFISTMALLKIGIARGEEAKPDTKIQFFTGKVELKTSASDPWVPAKLGVLIAVGTDVRTGEDSSCELTVGSGVSSAIKLKANSQVSLRSYEPVKIYLKSGHLLALVRGLQKGSSFKVVTPTAVASARGTGWAQSLDDLHVFEGNVYAVGSKGQEVVVAQGKKVDITKEGVLSSPVEFSSGLNGEWSEFKNIMEGLKKTVSLIDQPRNRKKKEKGLGPSEAEVSLEHPAGNEPYKILSLTTKRQEDATYYNMLTKKSDLLLTGMEIMGDDSLVCAKDYAQLTVKPVRAPFENRRVIEGPVSGVLSDLYYSATGASRQKYSQTIVAVQEGAVLASIIMHVGDKEVIVSSTLIRGDAEEKAPEELDENGALKRKVRVKIKKASDLVNQPAFKKDPNIMVIDPCGYVKVVYVANLNLAVNCAENVQQGLMATADKTQSKSADCSGKGPKVNAPPSVDELA